MLLKVNKLTSMTTKELIQSYYESLNKKNYRWQELWGEDVAFQDASGALNAQGKKAVVASFVPFLQGMDSVAVNQLIVEGNAPVP